MRFNPAVLILARLRAWDFRQRAAEQALWQTLVFLGTELIAQRKQKKGGHSLKTLRSVCLFFFFNAFPHILRNPNRRSKRLLGIDPKSVLLLIANRGPEIRAGFTRRKINGAEFSDEAGGILHLACLLLKCDGFWMTKQGRLSCPQLRLSQATTPLRDETLRGPTTHPFLSWDQSAHTLPPPAPCPPSLLCVHSNPEQGRPWMLQGKTVRREAVQEPIEGSVG